MDDLKAVKAGLGKVDALVSGALDCELAVQGDCDPPGSDVVDQLKFSPASLWGSAAAEGAARWGEAPRPFGEGGQGKPSVDLPGQSDLPTARCTVKEDCSQGLLPQSPVPGTHGNGWGPLQAVTEGVAFFASKGLWSDLATVGCHNVRNRDHMEAESDLIEEGELRRPDPCCCEEIHEVSVVVAQKWKVRRCRQEVDAMSGGVLPC